MRIPRLLQSLLPQRWTSPKESEARAPSGASTALPGANGRKELRKEIEQMSIRRQISESTAFSDFTTCLEELGNRDRDRSQVPQLIRELQTILSKTNTLRQIDKEPYVQALKEFLDAQFSSITKGNEATNTTVATVILSCHHPIIIDRVQNFLSNTTDKTALNFLKLVQSKCLSESLSIFQTLLTAGLQGITSGAGPSNKAEQNDTIINKLVQLSPGSDQDTKASNLLEKYLEHERDLHEQCQTVANDTDNSSNRLQELRQKLTQARYLLSALYQNKNIQQVIEGQHLLNLLKQSGDTNTENDDLQLLNTPLLKDSLKTSLQFSRAFPPKLPLARVQDALEGILENLSKHSSEHYSQALITTTKLYADHFVNQRAEDFLTGFFIGLLDAQDTNSNLRHEAVKTLSFNPSPELQKLLNTNLKDERIDNIATLFILAQSEFSECQPLRDFLIGLNDDEFMDCISKVVEERPLVLDLGLVLSIVCKQFTWDDTEDPLSQKLVKYLGRNGKFLEQYSRFLDEGGRFLDRYIAEMDNVKNITSFIARFILNTH